MDLLLFNQTLNGHEMLRLGDGGSKRWFTKHWAPPRLSRRWSLTVPTNESIFVISILTHLDIDSNDLTARFLRCGNTSPSGCFATKNWSTILGAKYWGQYPAFFQLSVFDFTDIRSFSNTLHVCIPNFCFSKNPGRDNIFDSLTVVWTGVWRSYPPGLKEMLPSSKPTIKLVNKILNTSCNTIDALSIYTVYHMWGRYSVPCGLSISQSGLNRCNLAHRQHPLKRIPVNQFRYNYTPLRLSVSINFTH